MTFQRLEWSDVPRTSSEAAFDTGEGPLETVTKYGSLDIKVIREVPPPSLPQLLWLVHARRLRKSLWTRKMAALLVMPNMSRVWVMLLFQR